MTIEPSYVRAARLRRKAGLGLSLDAIEKVQLHYRDVYRSAIPFANFPLDYLLESLGEHLNATEQVLRDEELALCRDGDEGVDE